MVDFYNQARKMRLADPEDRALLGSNPSAAVGDGDIDRSRPLAAPVPNFCPCPQSDKPIFHYRSTGAKPSSQTRPVCHLAISLERGSCS